MKLVYIAVGITSVLSLAMESPNSSTSPLPSTSPSPAAPQAKEGGGVLIEEDLFKLRDPFREPDVEIARVAPKSDLERYPVDAFKLIGVLTGPVRLRALVLAPDGKSYFVSEKMKIGLRGGTVLKISPDVIKVREKIVNVVGQEENLDSEIRMTQDDHSKDKEGLTESAGFSNLNSSR